LKITVSKRVVIISCIFGNTSSEVCYLCLFQIPWAILKFYQSYRLVVPDYITKIEPWFLTVFQKNQISLNWENFVNIRYFCINRLKKMHLSDSVILNDVPCSYFFMRKVETNFYVNIFCYSINNQILETILTIILTFFWQITLF